MGGYDPYSSSKGCAELVIAAYRRSFFNPKEGGGPGVGLASARAGNVIGGGDWGKDRLAPDILRAFASGTRPLIRFPAAIRPWQHVLEPLAGYMLLAEGLWGGDIAAADGWNFGAAEKDTRSVGWVADRLAALWGGGASWRLDTEAQPHEAAELRLDSTKARELLGWRPAWTLEEALRQTVEWRRALGQGADMRDFTLAQIRSYPSVRTREIRALAGE
jgi:CDP-glucose 4,6-dehydratase